MALEEFEREPLSERQKGLVRMRSITNYGMGIFILLIGCVFMFPTKYTAEFLDKYDPVLIKIFAAVCWLYGIFRIYRGYQKNYFRD
jgi:hypothetical protein